MPDVTHLRRALDERERTRIERLEVVPVAPLQERYLRLYDAGEITAAGVARLMHEAGHKGFMRKPTPSMRKRRKHMGIHPDTSRVRRMLGLMPHPNGQSRHKDGSLYPPTIAKYIRYEYAVTLAEILGLDYVDAGV